MAGYRGDGFGQYGNVGDDDFRFGNGGRGDRGRRHQDQGPRHGAAHGNLMGGTERALRSYFVRDDNDGGGGGDRDLGGDGSRLADDPRAVRAAHEWRARFGRGGHEGSYAQHDEPYRSYRERHLAEMDQDYADYCREHGLEFSGAFENWRQGRRSGGGMPAMSGVSGAPEVGGLGGAGGMSGAAEEPMADGGRWERNALGASDGHRSAAG